MLLYYPAIMAVLVLVCNIIFQWWMDSFILYSSAYLYTEVRQKNSTVCITFFPVYLHRKLQVSTCCTRDKAKLYLYNTLQSIQCRPSGWQRETPQPAQSGSQNLPLLQEVAWSGLCWACPVRQNVHKHNGGHTSSALVVIGKRAWDRSCVCSDSFWLRSIHTPLLS